MPTCQCGCGKELRVNVGRGQQARYAKGHWPSKRQVRVRTVPRVCLWCEKPFFATPSNVRMGWGNFCSKACTARHTHTGGGVKPTIRMLKAGESIPAGEPRRYVDGCGYVLLRWLVGTQTYVEAREHRIFGGVVCELQVHHVNGIKTDNRPENLVQLTASEHARLHAAERRAHGLSR